MSSTGSGYDQSVNTYSPDGKLYQVEYGMKAIESSGTAIGVRCRDGIIFGVEKMIQAKMLVPGGGRRTATIDEHIGAAVAGLLPDARQLISRARDESVAHRQNYGEPIPVRVLNERMGAFTHVFTTYWHLRPFGASIIIGGYDPESKTHELYCIDPTGMAMRYYGVAIGKGARAANTEIEKHKFGEKTVTDSLGLVAKIIHGVHDDTKDKPFELELSWVAAQTGWRHQLVPKDVAAQAEAWAKAQIQQEEMGDDDD